jgi:hypothetical protein
VYIPTYFSSFYSLAQEADLYGTVKYDTPVFLSDELFKISLKTEVDSALRYLTNFSDRPD